jgi:pSer/pThr/pTyr-binding forkhead associated (FHA) protein
VTIWIIQTPPDVEMPFTFRLLPGSVKTVGRSGRADFILDAGMVSRVHCRLAARPADLEVTDLDSTNGTYVNGQRITTAIIKAGDELGIGRVTFTVFRAEN